MSIKPYAKFYWMTVAFAVILICVYLFVPFEPEQVSPYQNIEGQSSPSVSKKTLIESHDQHESTSHLEAEIANELNLDLDLDTISPDLEIDDPLPRLLSSYTQAGAELDNFLEEHDVGYLDSSFYPFDAQTEAILRRYANSGKMLLFDNTQAKENLLEFNKTSGDVVADYYGTGSESSMTIATSIKLDNGGIEYMVLPVSTSDQDSNEALSERVKLAIELFEQEQEKKQEANANS